MKTSILPLLSCLGIIASTVALPTSALAGDLDGDGYDDLVVGAHRLDRVGKANVGDVGILNGSASGFTADELIEPTSQENGRAGFSVAMGDFNCDGFEDVAFGAPSIDSVYEEDGIVRVFYNFGDGTFGSNYSHELTRMMFDTEDIVGAEEEDHFGRSLAAADFDDDGCTDLAIGAPRARDVEWGSRSGVVYVAYGGIQYMGVASGSRNRIDPETIDDENARFGFSLATGDFTGDGVPELVIAAPTWKDPAQGNDTVGQIQIREYIGGIAGFDPLPQIPNGIVGENDDGWFGWSMATGDFDGDGTLDLAAGIPGYQNDFIGLVEIYSGTDLTTPSDALADADLNERFGYALVAGDLDDDGDDELAIGAPMATLAGGPTSSGAVWIHRGGDLAQYGSVLTPMDLAGNNSSNSQKFGSSLAMGHYSDHVDDLDYELDLVVGAKRAKADNGVRTGAVFMFDNTAGALGVQGKTSLEDFGWGASAGALFGSALSQ